MDSVRAMLDELMGKERDVPLPHRSNKKISYDDPLVCKYQLAGLCPNRLFKNTRSDLGPCPYEFHEDHIDWDSIQADYDKQDSREKERHERRLVKYLEELIRDMDRKVVKAKERAAAESLPKPLKPDDAARLADMQQRVKDMLQRSQELGEQGDVDASMMLAQQAEELRQQHDRLHKQLTAADRTMTVCDICGVFINSTDNDQRRLDHLTGKQYLGWKAIREKFAELTEKLDGGRQRSASRGPDAAAPSSFEPPPRSDRSDRSDRDRERDRERDRDRDRDRERERDYGRDKERDRYGSDRRDYGGRDGYSGGGRDRDYRGEREHSRDYRERERGGDYGDYGGYSGSSRDYRGGSSRGGYGEVAPPKELYGRPSSGSHRDRYEEDRRRR